MKGFLQRIKEQRQEKYLEKAIDNQTGIILANHMKDLIDDLQVEVYQARKHSENMRIKLYESESKVTALEVEIKFLREKLSRQKVEDVK